MNCNTCTVLVGMLMVGEAACVHVRVRVCAVCVRACACVCARVRACVCRVRELCGKSLYLLLHFTVNLKLL